MISTAVLHPAVCACNTALFLSAVRYICVGRRACNRQSHRCLPRSRCQSKNWAPARTIAAEQADKLGRKLSTQQGSTIPDGFDAELGLWQRFVTQEILAAEQAGNMVRQFSQDIQGPLKRFATQDVLAAEEVGNVARQFSSDNPWLRVITDESIDAECANLTDRKAPAAAAAADSFGPRAGPLSNPSC
eukprot:TRINITY_DN76776_c0_g1_i1.p1 TRINITY_DN76776_c0_g1~~TRINITY_DN76776_c0_g1_i1.p1  ORF type:complete len:188 (-),score=35.19 TRINITY_DN76776_c0_g1_i1:277-840(-)